MRRVLYFLLLLGCTLTGIACQPTPALTNTVTPEPTEAPAASAIDQATPEVTTAENEAQIFVLWMPDQLYPAEGSDAAAILESQIESFAATQTNLQIEIRRKAATDVGGVLSTLRSASGVAPGAVPDLTLLRYDDFLAAEQANLIFPFEGLAAATMVSELSDTAVQLATIEEQLYGVPYLIDVLMAAHNQENLSEQSTSYDDVLESRLRYASLPNRSGGISEVFWLQYLAAGGTPLDPATGTATINQQTINQQALLEALTFYEDLFQAGLIDETILDYVSTSDYLPGLLDGSLDFGVMNSTQFNRLASQSANVYAGTVPTENGTVISQVNGWIWVITTGDSQQQAAAGRLVNWLLDLDRQGEYAQALGMIPSRSDTLQLYPPNGLSVSFIDSLLEQAQPPITSMATSNALRAMQSALISVVSGETSAREAAQRAIDQLSG